MTIMKSLAAKAIKRMASVRTEAEFWSEIMDLAREFSSWPGGLLVLWTPTAPYLIFEFESGGARLVELIGDETIAAGLTKLIRPYEMAEVRRNVRDGQWVISLRNTQYQWRHLYDARDVHTRFRDPLVSLHELGLAAMEASWRKMMRALYPA